MCVFFKQSLLVTALYNFEQSFFPWLVMAYLRAALLCRNSAVFLLPLVRSFLRGDGENISHKFEASQLMSFMGLKTETPTKLITHFEFTCAVLYLRVCVFCTNVYIARLIEGQTLSVGRLIHRNAA